MSDCSSDDFSIFDFSAFTEDDFARLDAIQNNVSSPRSLQEEDSFQIDTSAILNLESLTEEDFAKLDSMIAQGDPSIAIELEEPSLEKEEEVATSPIQQFRNNGILSVSDLVSPFWCEVQFDYGLRQRRSRPIETRPKSFTSSSGKKISVAKSVAAKNDVRTKQGRAVHKELEREIRQEELKVEIHSEEERWAIRMVNIIASLKTIIEEGFTREMPVFGVIHDKVVVGIVDEVFKPPQATPGNNVSAIYDNESAFITDNTPPAPSTRSLHSLHIIDTKTRLNESLPKDEDTLSSRLQVMLYHRLLSDLVTSNPPYDFPALWKKLGLRSAQKLSTAFLMEAKLISHSDNFQVVCLDDLATSWHNLVACSNISAVDPTLELVYRLQPESLGKGKGRMRMPAISQTKISDGYDNNVAKMDSTHAESSGNAGTSALADDQNDLALQWAIQQSLAHSNTSDSRIGEPSNVQLHESKNGIDHLKIIGRKKVFYDGSFLENHIADIFRWWSGLRKPRGVPIELVRRCYTCEYCSDCEWREEKAKELEIGVQLGGEASPISCKESSALHS